MRLPDTQNASHLHAFKKGYRLAMEGKTLNSAPSEIRYQQTLRDYCQLGWEQAQEDMADTAKVQQKQPWRQRLAWFVVMVMGGLATAAGLIHTQSQPAQQVLQTKHSQAETPSSPLPPVTDQESRSATVQITETSPALQDSPAERLSATQPTLGLLSEQQRQDLVLTQQEWQAHEAEQVVVSTDSPPLAQADFTLEKSVLTSSVVNKEAVDDLGTRVPKHVRKLYFFSQVHGATGQTIYHRWLFQGREMALIPLPISSNLYRTWSSKRMTSAWQGEWHLEILNAQKQVIYRYAFHYGN
jgi:ribosome modulation factor